MIIKKKLFISLLLFIIIFLIQNVFAITANSSNYSVDMYGSGIQSYNASSSTFETRFLSENQGTTRNAIGNSITGNVGFYRDTVIHYSVTITSYSIYPRAGTNGSIIQFYISAKNPQAVWLKITLPNSTEQTIALVNNVNAYYIANQTGRYNIIFYANSSTGSISSVVDYFDINATQQSTQVVTVVSGGGGGGGSVTTVNQGCTYKWECGSWSICSIGKQKRDCVNTKVTGNCTKVEGILVQERECIDALFDVKIDLKDMEIIKNNALKFNVTLKETKGAGKIDVQLKYSLYNSENEEIYSQIETRAVEGNLTFEKVLFEDIKLLGGEYKLRVDILYGNAQRAYTEQEFRIIEETKEPEKKISLIDFISKLKTPLMMLLYLITLILILIGLKEIIKRIKMKKILEDIKYFLINIFKGKSKDNKLSNQFGKEVYSENGDKIGRIVEAYITENRIYGWLIKPNSKISNLTGNRNILIPHKHVKSIGDMMIVEGGVLTYLE